MAIDDVLNSMPPISEDEFAQPDAQETQESQGATQKPQPEQVQSEQVQKTVPLEALREERERRKELQAQLQAMEHRLQMILNAMQQPKTPEPEPAVSYDDDPIAYLRTKIDALNEQIARMTQTTETQAQQQQYEAFTRNIAVAEQQFAKDHPDYWDAVQFLRDRRMTELKALGYTEQQIMPVLAQDAAMLVQQAAANSKNPAEFAYQFAQQLGYQSKQAPQGQQPQAPAFEPPTSLGAATGSANTGVPTAQEISKMSDAEFQALFKKYFPG